MIDGPKAHGHRDVAALESPADLARMVADITRDGDMVICLGAGNITQWANALPDQLRASVEPAVGGEAHR